MGRVQPAAPTPPTPPQPTHKTKINKNQKQTTTHDAELEAQAVDVVAKGFEPRGEARRVLRQPARRGAVRRLPAVVPVSCVLEGPGERAREIRRARSCVHSQPCMYVCLWGWAHEPASLPVPVPTKLASCLGLAHRASLGPPVTPSITHAQVEVDVSCVAQARVDQQLGRLADDRLVDVAWVVGG